MTMLTIGDMAQTFLLQRQNAQLKNQTNTLMVELATGLTSNIASHLSGNYSYLSDIEHGLRVLEGFETATNEATLFTSVMQSALGNIQDSTSDLASSLISISGVGVETALNSTSLEAQTQLASIVSSLNSSVAGRSLFSGVAVDSSAMMTAQDMLATLQTVVSGESSVSGIVAAVDDWFDTPGGGFESLAYQGADQGMAPFQLGEGESVDLDLRADDQVFRNLLKQTALAALAGDETLGYSVALKGELLVTAGENLLGAQDQLTAVRADLGFAESRIEESTTRIAAEKTSLEYALGELLGVDQYETATRLENVQFQLESLYAVTVRLSRLSLVDYL